jgi:hypothetical protein
MRDPSSGHDASLHFIGGQLLLEYKDGEAVVRKCISPEAARNAFSSAGIDSDWLPEHVCRYGIGPGGPWLLLRFSPGRYQIPLADPIRLSGGGAPHTMLAVPMRGCCFSGTGPVTTSGPTSFGSTRQQNSSRHRLQNVYPDGAICFGSVHPRVAHGNTIANSWRLFWDSNFSDHLANGKSNTHPTISFPSWRNFTQQRHKTILSMILSRLTSHLPPSFVN